MNRMEAKMSVQERRAWFVLAVAVAALILCLVLGVLLGYGLVVFGGLSVLALAAGTGLIAWREQRAGRVVMDERDREIERTASMATGAVFWVLFVAAAVTPSLVLGPHAVMRVPTAVFPQAMFVAAWVVLLVRSLVTIVLYRREGHGSEV